MQEISVQSRTRRVSTDEAVCSEQALMAWAKGRGIEAPSITVGQFVFEDPLVVPNSEITPSPKPISRRGGLILGRSCSDCILANAASSGFRHFWICRAKAFDQFKFIVIVLRQ